MRGTIIMWAGDHGTVAAGGRRYEFDIDHWQGNVVPATSMTVEVAIDDGELAALTPVSEAELARESLAAMTGEGRKYAKAVFADVGKDVAIGYGAFLVIALFVNLVSAAGGVGVHFTLVDLLSGDIAHAALGGGSGRGVLLVLLATASMAAPYFWKHRLAPLAFAVPLVVTAAALWPIYREHSRQRAAVEAMDEFGDAMSRMADQLEGQAGAFDTIGTGAWLLVAIVIFLAFKGVVRFLARGQGSVTSSSAS